MRRSSPAGSRVGSTSASTRTVSAPAPSTISASRGRSASGSPESSSAPGVAATGAAAGGREGGARQPFEDRRAQGAVQLALAERARHQVDGAGGHRTPVGEESGVGVGGALHEEVGERAGGGVRRGGVQRQGGDEQGGHAERLVAGGGRVHDGGGARAGGSAVGVDGDGPGDRPVRAQPLLDGTVGEQLGARSPCAVAVRQRGGAVTGVRDDGQRAVRAAAHGAYVPGADLDDDLLQAGQGEQQSVVDGAQQPLGEVGGGGVAQRQDDGGVVRVGGGSLGGEGEPQQRYVPVAAADLVAEAGAVPGGVPREVPRLGQRPAHPRRAGRRRRARR